MPRSMYSKVPRHSILATRPQRLLIISPRRQVLKENEAGILFDSRDYVTTLELGRFFPRWEVTHPITQASRARVR